MENQSLMKTIPIYLRKRKRLPGLKRAGAGQLPNFRLTPRDQQIIQAVYRYRALTASQIAALFFSSQNGGEVEVNARCKHRLRMLFHHGYLFRGEQPSRLSEGRKPLVYFLDRRGAELLAGVLGAKLDWKASDNNVSNPFLQHLLTANDVRVGIMLSAERLNWQIEKYLDDKSLRKPQMKDRVTLIGPQGGKMRAAVVPDGYFRLATDEDTYNFFLEIDMGTVTGHASVLGKRDWSRKVRAYLEYYSSGAYQKRYKTQDMRVLTITTGQKRSDHLRGITEASGGKARFWFTTFGAIKTHNILTSRIWSVATREGLHPLV